MACSYRELFVVSALVGGCVSGFAFQVPAADPSMMQADAAFVQALAKGDKAALEKLVDADFTWTDYNGKTLTRAQFLQTPGKPAVANDASAEHKQYTYGDLGNVQANQGRAHALRIYAKRSGAWKAIDYQEVMSLENPPTATPGAGKDCENPCKKISFTPKTETEKQVATAYSKLETAAMAHNSPVFATLVGDEFVAASSNSNKLYDKQGRIDDFNHSKMAGVAPTPLMSARMFTFGDAVLMISEHIPDKGLPLHVTRVWSKRGGNWVETLSYQTSVQPAKP